MNRIILLILSVVNVLSAYCQTDNYPNDSGIIQRDGYTYKYTPTRLGNFSKDLYNSDAVYHGVTKIARLDGRFESYDEKMAAKSGIDGANKGKDYINNLIKSKFSTAQINLIRESVFGLIMKLSINTTTGEVADVVFNFPGISNFKYIPVEVFRSIELDLKEQLQFTINDRGREFNYGRIVWVINF